MKDKFIAISLMMLSLTCLANVVRSVNGAVHSRFSVSAEEMVTAKDYVQDGLIAMYDGIENVGYGQHSVSSTIWVNLAGTGWDGDIGRRVVIEKNAVLLDGIRGVESAVTIGKGWFGKPSKITIECMIQPMGWNYRGENGDVAAFGGTEATTGGFTLWANNSYQVHGCCMQVRDAEKTMRIAYPYSMSSDMGGVWHIGLTMDGEEGISYANGAAYDFKSMGELVYTRAENYDFFIGGDYWGPVEYNFNGRIFFVRVYDRALSADEIAYNHAVDVERFNVP